MCLVPHQHRAGCVVESLALPAWLLLEPGLVALAVLQPAPRDRSAIMLLPTARCVVESLALPAAAWLLLEVERAGYSAADFLTFARDFLEGGMDPNQRLSYL